MIYSLLRFESRSAWDGFKKFYESLNSSGGDECGNLFSPEWKEEFFRKNLYIEFCEDDVGGGANVQGWAQTMLTRFAPIYRTTAGGDSELSHWAWVFGVKCDRVSVLDPSGCHAEMSFRELREFLKIDSNCDGYWHYNLNQGKQVGELWNWQEFSLPPLTHNMSLLVWDGYLCRENSVCRLDQNLIVLLRRVLQDDAVGRLRVLICVFAESDPRKEQNDVESMKSALSVLRKEIKKNFEFGILELGQSAGKNCGGHGRWLVSPTFSVNSGKGFNFVGEGNFNAESMRCYCNFTRFATSLQDFEDVLGRVSECIWPPNGSDLVPVKSSLYSSGKAESKINADFKELCALWRVAVNG